jgi:hypothetical protein
VRNDLGKEWILEFTLVYRLGICLQGLVITTNILSRVKSQKIEFVLKTSLQKKKILHQ